MKQQQGSGFRGQASGEKMTAIPTCQYCGRQGVWDMWEHEQTCDYNPDNKTCFTCFDFNVKADHMLYYADLFTIDCSINQAVKHLGEFQGYVRNCTAWKPYNKNEGGFTMTNKCDFFGCKNPVCEEMESIATGGWCREHYDELTQLINSNDKDGARNFFVRAHGGLDRLYQKINQEMTNSGALTRLKKLLDDHQEKSVK